MRHDRDGASSAGNADGIGRMTLSAKQRDVINTAMEPGIERTITAVCDAARVSRDTFYRWLRDSPEFRDAWENAWHGAIRRHLPGVVAAMIDRALAGDVKAARLVADLAGVITREHRVTLDTTLRQEAERLAKELDLDPAELLAEAEAIIRGGA